MELSVYVVDGAHGVAATEVGVRLRQRLDAGWRELASGQTGADGLLELWRGGPVDSGVYQVVFDLDRYYAILGAFALYPRAIVEFRVSDPDADVRLSLMTTPHSYTTFRCGW
jgi:5-hydroxyisourate hydrolase